MHKANKLKLRRQPNARPLGPNLTEYISEGVLNR
jgi:hypothetical protein